jgi:hypothetical protein
MINWKGFGRKRSWSIRDIIPAFAWRNPGKSRNTSVRIACILVENRNEPLPNITVELRVQINLFGPLWSQS